MGWTLKRVLLIYSKNKMEDNKKTIESMRIQVKSRKIDGVTFEEPQNLYEHILNGILICCMIILLPLWILPYLVSKLFTFIAEPINTYGENFLCPKCDALLKYDRERLQRIECPNCHWYSYLDWYEIKSAKEIIKRKNGNYNKKSNLI